MSLTIKLDPITLTKSQIKELRDNVDHILSSNHLDESFVKFGEKPKALAEQIVKDPKFLLKLTESINSYIADHVSALVEDPWEYDLDLDTDLFNDVDTRLSEIDVEIDRENRLLIEAEKEKQEIIDLSVKLKEALELLKQSGYKIVESH